MQSEIADQLGARLGGFGVIEKAERGAALRSRPGNLTAYELYLAGRIEHLSLTKEGNKKALELFERAVAADPGLARAWSELSSAHSFSVGCCGADPAAANAAALAAARRAIEADPRDAMAHAQLGVALGILGDLAPSKAEFDAALRLNPGDAEVLALYAGWAPSFDHAEPRADAAADQAIRLNPNYQKWQGWNFSYAYFCAARFEDALHVLERLSKDNYINWNWVVRAASYAALGQSAKAKAAVTDALAHIPDLTIEGFTGTADVSDADRKNLIGPMRAAGFPVCASPETLAKNPQLIRLPECLSK